MYFPNRLLCGDTGERELSGPWRCYTRAHLWSKVLAQPRELRAYGQSRGVMPFSCAYLVADASTRGRTSAWSVAIQSVSTVHCLGDLHPQPGRLLVEPRWLYRPRLGHRHMAQHALENVSHGQGHPLGGGAPAISPLAWLTVSRAPAMVCDISAASVTVPIVDHCMVLVPCYSRRLASAATVAGCLQRAGSLGTRILAAWVT